MNLINIPDLPIPKVRNTYDNYSRESENAIPTIKTNFRTKEIIIYDQFFNFEYSGYEKHLKNATLFGTFKSNDAEVLNSIINSTFILDKPLIDSFEKIDVNFISLELDNHIKNN